jgi:RNA recognition motif-containing protein
MNNQETVEEKKELREVEEEYLSIYIGNLSFNIDEKDVQNLLEKYTKIKSVTFKRFSKYNLGTLKQKEQKDFVLF